MRTFLAYDQLFKELCKPDVMRVGWYLAYTDSRDDFVTDPIGHADFAMNLDERLQHVVEQVQTYRYRPRHLLDIDIPKSGLSVRPGNVLPIEESSLLHAIVYLLAPHLDKRLDEAVYSFRLHPEWKRRVKKRESLFRESPIEFPFLKRSTIRLLTPFESWYELWPDFEVEAVKAFTEEGYTHLTKTDITAFFENIDLRLLESQIRALLKREEEKTLQILFRILDGWTRVTSTGAPIGRGIPQGNEVGSFFGNLYLIPLDRRLSEFCKTRDAKWFRYVDDVKVFTKSEHDARQAVFIINDALRTLHLNLQGSKTEVIAGDRLKYELDNTEIDAVDTAFEKLKNIDPSRRTSVPKITETLKPLATIRSRFTRGLPSSVTKLDGKQNRVFRRLLTLYGKCQRPQFRNAALTAMKQLPDMRILRKSLTYLSQLAYKTHVLTLGDLLDLLESEELPFPYQAGVVLETIGNLHPLKPRDIASRIRKYALSKKRDWFVVQRALEAMAVYPYQDSNALTIAKRYLRNDHPMVRRAAFLLLVRSPKHEVRERLDQLIYNADPSVSRLALYFRRHIRETAFAQQELSRMQHGGKSDVAFQRSLPKLYTLAASEEKAIAAALSTFVISYPATKSAKLAWHRDRLTQLTEWSVPASERTRQGGRDLRR